MSYSDTIFFHKVTIVDKYKACVALYYKNESVYIIFKKHTESGTIHNCNLPTINTTEPLPSIFNADIAVEKISLVANRILESDAHAMEQFLEGVVIIKPIPLNDPPLLDFRSDNPGLEEYREIMLPYGYLVRPLLLSSPNIEYLRPFQFRGVEWLLNHESGILADDMGLGKTVQTVTALRLLFNLGMAKNALVICPKSLLANWEEEFSRWSPEVSHIRVTPPASIRDEVWKIVLGRTHVILTNYEQLRKPPEILQKYSIDIVVADEVHRIRNIGALATEGIKLITRKMFWGLTGTPLEKDATDLVTLLTLLEPTKFSGKDKSLHTSSLQAQIQPYVLRRLKSDVLEELPEVIEFKQTLELLPSQRRSYNRVRRRLSGADDLGVLAVINELRTICDYDAISGESVKVERILEILQNIQASGEKAIVFSYLLRPLDILQDRIVKIMSPKAVVQLRGSMNVEAREETLRIFKTDPSVMALLCSSRVGGEGLTLTEANHVIFFNEWWNPSANLQARDRVVRIGQRRGVSVYKFRCRRTIEDDLEAILADKSQLMVDLVDQLAETAKVTQDARSIIMKLRSRLQKASE